VWESHLGDAPHREAKMIKKTEKAKKKPPWRRPFSVTPELYSVSFPLDLEQESFSAGQKVAEMSK
jgi:hypothetical protein